MRAAVACVLMLSACGYRWALGRTTLDCQEIEWSSFPDGWVGSGCGREAWCDSLQGDWSCTRVIPGPERARRQFTNQTSCHPKELTVAPFGQRLPGEPRFTIEGCGWRMLCQAHPPDTAWCETFEEAALRDVH